VKPSLDKRVPVPLSTREKLKVAGIVLALVAGAAAGWWAYSSQSYAATAVERLVAHLERGEASAAFELLAPELRQELGSADALDQRWRSTGLTRLSLSYACGAGGVGPEVVVMDAVAERRDGAAAQLELGDVGAAKNKRCKREPRAPLVALVSNGRVVALRFAP
jgi:hypothetical protein